MRKESVRKLLEDIQAGRATVEEGMEALKTMPVRELEYARIDTHRELRTGFPEVIYCEGKTAAQVRGIIERMLETGASLLATRASEGVYGAVRDLDARLEYNPAARAIFIKAVPVKSPDRYIAIVSAGTADMPVAEEAAVTAEVFGNRAERFYDVGVAGIHRLMDRIDAIRGACAIVAVAGMEGALASVVAGLVEVPVIAVPTSVGYGASFGGLSALLTMINSCAAGVSVVNIDNGFGAGYLASMIAGM